MAKNWKTTLAGAVFAVLTFLQGSGVHVGHVGNTDIIAIAQAAAAAVLGAYAKDKDVTGTGTNAKTDPQG